MRDLEQTDGQKQERMNRYRLLFVEEWRRQRFTNAQMAIRLGKSLSLTNKLKAGTTPLTAPVIDKFVEVLGINPIRAMFAVDIAMSHMSYFDPAFQSACTTAITFFDQVMVEFGYARGLSDPAMADTITAERVEETARMAASTLAASFLRGQPTGHGHS
jgi:hypothetical protein